MPYGHFPVRGPSRQKRGVRNSDRPRFVFITNSNSPFWDAARKGLDDAAKEFGAEVELIRNDSSPAGQIRRLEQVAAQRDVKGVMVSVVEPNASGIIDQMKALRAKGIPVLALDSDGQKETRDAYIGTNNIEAGRALGRAAAQLLPGGGKAVAFVGIRSAQNAQERVNGFKEGAGAQIQVVDVMEDSGDVNKARRNVAAALQNHPDLKMLVGIWSYNAPAIVDEVKAAGKRSSLKLVTFDAEPNTLACSERGPARCNGSPKPLHDGISRCEGAEGAPEQRRGHSESSGWRTWNQGHRYPSRDAGRVQDHERRVDPLFRLQEGSRRQGPHLVMSPEQKSLLGGVAGAPSRSGSSLLNRHPPQPLRRLPLPGGDSLSGTLA